MQDTPDADRLLDAMADTLEQRVLDHLTGSAQHQVRVVVNLCRILAREHRLDPTADTAARAALADLLGETGPEEATTRDLWVALATTIDALPRSGTPDQPAPLADAERVAAEAHRVLTTIVGDKVAVARPDYLRMDDPLRTGIDGISDP